MTQAAGPAGPDPAGSGDLGRRTWIVLPAFNEEEALPSLFTRLERAMVEARLDYTVVLVDDGSRDGTAGIAERAAERMPLVLERHPENLGLGATIRDGLTRASELAHPEDVVVTMDADDSQTPELIYRMVRTVREGHDVVVASRYRPGSRVLGVPALRRFASWGGSWLFRILFPTPGLRDFTCGFRAYRADVLQEALRTWGDGFFDQGGFQSMVDILLKLRRRRPPLVFGEVPFVLRYDFKPGASKMNVAATIRNTLRLIVVRRLGG